MKPSLFVLFKRGRYFRLAAPDDDESGESARTRSESERFVAAAIGFCMIHEKKFRDFFLKEICDFEKRPPSKFEIEIEPENWADLLIRFGNRNVCVVEFKLGAALQPHQDPTNENFWKSPDGYGVKLEKAYPNALKRFVVFGHSEYLYSLPKKSNWHFVQKDWHTLADGFQEQFTKSKLLCDLRDCLARFEIYEFVTMKVKDFHMSSYMEPQVGIGSMAWEILWNAFVHPELNINHGITSYRTDISCDNPNNWHFGIEIQTSANDVLAALIRPTLKNKGAMIWIGFESAPRRKSQHSVWIYCENEQIASLIKNIFSSSAMNAPSVQLKDNEKGERTYICIKESSPHRSSRDWFVGLLIHLKRFAHDARDRGLIQTREVRRLRF